MLSVIRAMSCVASNAIVALGGIFLFAPAVHAVQLEPGDIVITADIGSTPNGENYGLLRIDPVTGDRTIISDATHGAGPAMDLSLPGIERLPDNRLLVAAANGLFYVDPVSGDRTLLTPTAAVGTVFVDNQIYAEGGSGLFRVDPVTGTTTPLNAGALPNSAGLTSADGQLIVTAGGNGFAGYSLAGNLQGIYQIGFPGSLIPYGNDLVLYGNIGGPLSIPGIYTFDPSLPEPFGKHLVSGVGVGEPSVGSGPALHWAAGLGVGLTGTIFVANLDLVQAGNILAVDPITGNRSILSDALHGAGPTFLQPTGLAVVPEPSALVLVIAGLACAIAWRHPCRNG